MITYSKDNDTWNNRLYGIPSGLYYYLIYPKVLDNFDWATSYLGNCTSIQSVQYAPFIDPNDLTVWEITYDSKRFADADGVYGGVESPPPVYRIMQHNALYKNIYKFNTYPSYGSKTVGGALNWRNESRLYNYPYSYGVIADGLSTPLTFKYHLCPNVQSQLKCCATISSSCNHTLFIEDYNGDTWGLQEGLTSTGNNQLPVSSSVYTSWVGANQNQAEQNIRNLQATTLLQNQGISNQAGIQAQINGVQQTQNLWGGLTGTIGNLLSLNFGGALQSGVNSYFGGQVLGLQNALTQSQASNSIALNKQTVQNQISSYMATASDMKNIPNSMISMGGDFIHNHLRTSTYNEDFLMMLHQLYLYRYRIRESEMQRLGNYFHLYGYKQNKIAMPYTRNRYYFNYIKTVGSVVTGKLPRNIIQQIQDIFDKGVTIWHVNRSGVEMLNYMKDNYEYNDYSRDMEVIKPPNEKWEKEPHESKEIAVDEN